MEMLYRKARGGIALIVNFFLDLILYIKHSGLLWVNNEEKLISLITFNYHTIEKGLSMPDIRYGFGERKIILILKRVNRYIKSDYNLKHSQFIVACSVLNHYYVLHEDAGYDISAYFNSADFQLIKSYSKNDIGGFIPIKKADYFKDTQSDYASFSKSRHSVRSFSAELVKVSEVEQAVELAKYCPSACNRQSSRVYLVEDEYRIQSILKVQMGILATANDISQLIVVTASRNSFFTSGERNQHFVDGGIFLQSLLLSLHYYKIAACPLHWSLNYGQDKRIRQLIKFSGAEKVIALIAIGYLRNDLKVPYSHRKEIREIFYKVE